LHASDCPEPRDLPGVFRVWPVFRKPPFRIPPSPPNLITHHRTLQGTTLECLWVDPRLVCRSEDSWRAFGCPRSRCPDKAYWFGCQLVRRLLFRGGNVLAKWRLNFTLSVRMHEQHATDIQRVATVFCFALGCCWERMDCVLLFERYLVCYTAQAEGRRSSAG